jgi:hypothetical protein
MKQPFISILRGLNRSRLHRKQSHDTPKWQVLIEKESSMKLLGSTQSKSNKQTFLSVSTLWNIRKSHVCSWASVHDKSGLRHERSILSLVALSLGYRSSDKHDSVSL